MDASHDDYTSSNAETEPTPVPSPIGPPPPHQLPTSPLLGWSDSDNADDEVYDDDELDDDYENAYSGFPTLERQQQKTQKQVRSIYGGYNNSNRNSNDSKGQDSNLSNDSFPSAPSAPHSSSRVGSLRKNSSRPRSTRRNRNELSTPPVGVVVVSQERRRYDEDENDTFYDDRSLECRLRQALDGRPRSVKVTTSGSLSLSTGQASKGNRNRAVKRVAPQKQDPGHDEHYEHHEYPAAAAAALDQSRSTQASTPSLSQASIPPPTTTKNENVETSAFKLKEELARLSRAVEDLTVTNTVLTKNNIDVSTVVEANKSTSKEQELLVHDQQARAESIRLSNELDHMQANLESEKETSTTALLDMTERNTVLEKTISDSMDCIQRLTDEHLSSEQKMDSMSKKRENVQIELSQIKKENVSLQETIQSLGEKIEEREKATVTATDAVQALSEELLLSEQKIDALTSNANQARGQLADLQKVHSCLHKTVESLENKLEEANNKITGLDVVNKEAKLESEKKLVDCCVQPHESSSIAEEFPVRAHHHLSPTSAFVSDRLSRIRESTERATIVKEHQQEINKLVANHDADLKHFAMVVHEKRDRDDEAREVEKRCRAEFESKLVDLESDHQYELEKTKAEADRKDATASRSIQAAMVELASLRVRSDREEKRRVALEIDKNQMVERHMLETESIRHSYEGDKNNFLAVVQKECNIVFDRTRSKGWSPRSVTNAVEFFPRKKPISVEPSTRGDDAALTSVVSFSPSTALPSTVSSSPGTQSSLSISPLDLGESLRETEAYIQNMLSNPLDSY